jgi:putative RecB family exonuclease
MITYSYSRLDTFKQCRLKFKYQYIDRLPREVDAVETFLGSRFHEVMEKLYKDLRFHQSTLEDLKRYFNELWDKNWGEHVLISKPERTADDYRTIGLKALEDYYNRYHPFDSGRVLGVERILYLDLNGDGSCRLKCVIDRIMDTGGGNIEIHDYKTSGYLPAQSQLNRDWQLALYELAVRQAWPQTKNVDLVWHYVCFDKELRLQKTPEELEELKRNTVSLIDEIKSVSEYPPHQSDLCEWCNFQEICPLFSHRFKTDELPKNEYLKEEGVKLVNKYAELSARKSGLSEEIAHIEREQDKIKEAACEIAQRDGHEILYGSDHKLKIKDDIKIKYPEKKELIRPDFDHTVKDLGLWDKVADISYSKLKGIAKEDNWLKNLPEQLSPFVKIEPVKTVYLSKRKDVEDE